MKFEAFILAPVFYLFSQVAARNNDRPLSSVQKTEVKNAIKTIFENASECMRDGMFYNADLEDCEPCSACDDSRNDGCFIQCEAILKAESLAKDITQSKAEVLSIMDQNNHDFVIGFAVMAGAVVFLALLTMWLLYQRNKQEDKLQEVKVDFEKRCSKLEKKLDDHIDAVNQERNLQNPEGDTATTVMPPSHTTAFISENDRLLTDDEASDSGVSDPYSSQDTSV